MYNQNSSYDEYYNSSELYNKNKNKTSIKEPYVFTITAVNSIGQTVSQTTSDVLPQTIPSAPTLTSVLLGDSFETLNFTAPSDNGGTPITSYTANALLTGTVIKSSTGTSSPITITGLTNGTSYTFNVVATNLIGNSVVSNTITDTPGKVPSPPTNGTVTVNDSSLTVAFTSPTDNGGYSISSYTASALLSGTVVKSVTGTTSPITITGLTNGTSYTINIVATNARGNSTIYTLTGNFTPGKITDAPTIGSVIIGDQLATINFTPPVSQPGYPITKFTVKTSTTGTPIPNVDGPSTATSITVTGLVPKTNYTFVVTATNSLGESAASASSSQITAATVPSVATPVSTVPTANSVKINFTVPDAKGSAISKYIIRPFYTNAQGTNPTCDTPIVVTDPSILGQTQGSTATATFTTSDRSKTFNASPANLSTVLNQTCTTSATSGEKYDKVNLKNYPVGKEGKWKINKWLILLSVILFLTIVYYFYFNKKSYKSYISN